MLQSCTPKSKWNPPAFDSFAEAMTSRVATSIPEFMKDILVNNRTHLLETH